MAPADQLEGVRGHAFLRGKTHMRLLVRIAHLLLAVALTACSVGQVVPETPIPPSSTERDRYQAATLTKTPTKTLPPGPPTFTPSASPIPGFTLAESITPFPAYTPIPNPTAAPPTLAPPKSCPPTNQGVPTGSLQALLENWGPFSRDLVSAYLDYLNSGGTIDNLPSVAQPALVQDLTADGVPEIVIRSDYLDILGCKEGKYVVLFEVLPSAGVEPPRIWIMQDANANGVPELVVLTDSATQAGRQFSVIEWGRGRFRSEIAPSMGDNFRPSAASGAFASVVVTPKFSDVDGDGHLELVFHSGIPVWTIKCDFLPWREQDVIFEWDGTFYVPYQILYTAPTYRFQAVQDGDEYSLFGQYDNAIKSYEDAITNKKLDWWTEDRRNAESTRCNDELAGVTPEVVSPSQDPNEYPVLAPYSRFRIMLIQAITGDEDAVRQTFDALRATYQPDTPAGASTLMALEFIDKFRSTREYSRGLHGCDPNSLFPTI